MANLDIFAGIAQGISALEKDIRSERQLKQRQAIERAMFDEQKAFREQQRTDKLDAQRKQLQLGVLGNDRNELLRRRALIDQQITLKRADARFAKLSPEQQALQLKPFTDALNDIENKLSATDLQIRQISELTPQTQPEIPQLPQLPLSSGDAGEQEKAIGKATETKLGKLGSGAAEATSTLIQGILAQPGIALSSLKNLIGDKTTDESIAELGEAITTRFKQGKPVDKLREARRKLFDLKNEEAKKGELAKGSFFAGGGHALDPSPAGILSRPVGLAAGAVNLAFPSLFQTSSQTPAAGPVLQPNLQGIRQRITQPTISGGR